MIISRREEIPNLIIKIANNSLEQVHSYTYLGHLITEDGKSDKEISRRIGIARSAFMNMKNILTSREINLNTRMRMAKCYIWSTLLYGAETWTINKNSEDKLMAFEMWMLRRIMKIPWTARKTNEEVLRLSSQRRALMETIKKRKIKFLGHLLRHQSLQKLLLEGMIEGTRGRGRPRTDWMRNVRDWTYLSHEDCAREAQDRTWWRYMVVNLLEGDDT